MREGEVSQTPFTIEGYTVYTPRRCVCYMVHGVLLRSWRCWTWGIICSKYIKSITFLSSRENVAFASYFNIGLQIKQESSGWPSWVTVVATEPDPMVLWQKQGEYLERYLEKGGVYLFFYLRKNAWNKMFSECFVYLCRYGFGKRPNIQEPRAKDYHKINVEQFLGEVQRITKQDQSQPNDWSLWTVEHYRKPPERCTGIQILSVDMIEVISRRREVIKPPLKTRTRVDALTSMRLPSRPGRHA